MTPYDNAIMATDGNLHRAKEFHVMRPLRFSGTDILTDKRTRRAIDVNSRVALMSGRRTTTLRRARPFFRRIHST